METYKLAIIYYDKALAIDPENTDAIKGKGNVLSHIGNQTESIAHYNKTLSQSSNNTNIVNKTK